MKTKKQTTLLILIIILYAGCAGKNQEKAENDITCEKYELIKNTMEYPDVVKIMGRKHTTLTRDSSAGLGEIDLYTWKNPDGSSASISFLSGRVIQKRETNICTNQTTE